MPDNWKKEVCTIPNLLSLFRLLLIPVYTALFLRAEKAADYWLADGVHPTAMGHEFIKNKWSEEFKKL